MHGDSLDVVVETQVLQNFKMGFWEESDSLINSWVTKQSNS